MSTIELREAKRTAVRLLRGILNGSMSPRKAGEAWPKFQQDPLLDKALHLLGHFEEDDDIRMKDSRYAEWQFREIEKIVKELVAPEGLVEGS